MPYWRRWGYCAAYRDSSALESRWEREAQSATGEEGWLSMASEVRIIGLQGLPNITPGMDLAQLIVEAAQVQELTFIGGDILVVTQKIVSKAEGQLVESIR